MDLFLRVVVAVNCKKPADMGELLLEACRPAIGLAAEGYGIETASC